MGVAEEDQSTDMDEEIADRLAEVDQYRIPTTALERYASRDDIDINSSGEGKRENICASLTNEQFSHLLTQYKYAGEATINYFVVTGLNEFSQSEIEESVREQSPTQEQQEGIKREIFLADTEQFSDRLYLSFGYFDSTSGVDPQTGQPTSDFITRRCVAVVDEESELVEIRGSDTKMAERALDKIGNALGINRSDNIYRPDFNAKFQEEFGDELVEKYTNLSIRTKNRSGTTVDTMKFTSGTDERGERQDVREDDRVNAELDDHDGEITMGYVELKDKSRFFINRNKSRISFRQFEQESKLNEVKEVINSVLRQTGGYKQHKLSELDIVPE